MNIFTDYIKEINQLYQTGNATEHSYRPALKKLIESILTENGELSSLIQVINEPRRIDCGSPDYIITRANIPVCYIEAKDIGSNLNSKQNKAQIDRYINALDNIIITDYLTFIFYQKQERVETIQIAECNTNFPVRDNSSTGKLMLHKENFAKFENFIRAFAQSEPQSIIKSQKLAEIMASKAKLMAEVIEKILNDTLNPCTFHLEKKEFQEHLIKNISNTDFADIYAQTITYGMFAARLQSSSNFLVREELSTGKLTLQFDRKVAAELIPKTNPFLRKLFQNIAVFDLDTRFSWIVDDLAESFRVTDMNAVMGELGDKDPIIHFYEYFLSEYNPTLRKNKGVYYTPSEVVNFIVRAVDDILVSDFELPMGLADTTEVTPTFQSAENNTQSPTGKSESQSLHKVQILDPATGTGTFLVETIKQIHQKFSNQQGLWQSYVSDHLLPRLNGFEILMAPYTMAHLNLNWTLEKTGFVNEYEKRLRIFLTNSLDEFTEGHRGQNRLFSQEADEAGSVKIDTPVMVVFGNPPYSGESQNSGVWMNKLLNDYKKEHSGAKLQERTAKWLNDDYVKFIRFGQHFIEKNGEGILAFITNHSFLDNPTFRGMRWNLLNSFDKIYIIDLHGNTLKKEKTPDGSKDENVFNIKQGVSINIFVKSNSNFPVREESSTRKLTPLTEIYHYDLYGKRKDKFNFLLNNNLSTIPFKKVKSIKPYYFFTQKDFKDKKEYDKGFRISDLMHVYGVGITTAHDDFVVDINKDDLLKRFIKFKSSRPNPDLLYAEFNVVKKGGWDIMDGWNNLQNTDNLSDFITPISYRPFDNRFIFYEDKIVWRCVRKIMRHFMNGPNVGLIFKRGFSEESPPLFVSNHIIDFRSWSRSGMQGGDYFAPLYLKPDKENGYMEPNMNMAIVQKIAKFIGLPSIDTKQFFSYTISDENNELTPINIFDYIYARLHSPSYREKYKEFLKIDFPRVPYPESAEEFWHYVKIGGKLRKLHLLEGVTPDNQIASFNVAGSNVIEYVKYDPPPAPPINVGGENPLINVGGENPLINVGGEIPLINVEGDPPPTFVGGAGGENKVYINDTQYFDNVPKEAWDFYIGGYQPAQKWLKDRKGKALSYDDIVHYQKIIKVLQATYEEMTKIDLFVLNDIKS